jgi:histone chaperone ASF1
MKGVTVLLLQCSYRQKEFIRVGYYVNNEMPGDTIVQPLTLDNPAAAAAASSSYQQHQPTATEAMMLALQQQDPQQTVEDTELNQGLPADPNLLIRSVLADKPRVTRFNIPWTAAQEAEIDMNNDDIMGGSSTGAISGADGSSATGGTGNDMMDYDDIGMQLDEIGITDDESSAEDSANDGNNSSNENDNVEIDLDDGDSDGSNQYDDQDDDDDNMATA